MPKKIPVCFISSRDCLTDRVSLDLHIGYIPRILPSRSIMVSEFEVDNVYIHFGGYEESN